ncbi:PAS domain-containing sensor histidine kinase [Arthrobacter sp. ATA002]|uniref:PAS domain-containing sensor histidine kinase n=1 Tax=Arthrobacter sp. ATA002 TaxID=2991715 RepID=UPI0022A6E804|nr:PAS domain-containing sensor histidine kinase [Arthrobacter sp. ATA002]WAP52050.1 PAS domain-containing sensor histidine kinase [Arthrobacter sp. ATA002]
MSLPETPGNDSAGGAARQAAVDYEAHFHAAPSGYLMTGTDGTVLDVNRTLSRWLGLDRGRIIGASVLELMPMPDRVLYASFAMVQLGVSGGFEEMALALTGAGGDPLPMLVSGVRDSAAGHAGAGDGGVDRLTFFSAPKRTQFERDLAAALRKAGAAEAARAAAEELLLEKQRALEAKDLILQENLALSREREALLDTVLNTADVGLLVVDGDGGTVLLNSHLAGSMRRVAGGPGEPDAVAVFGADRVTPLPPEMRPITRAAAGETFTDEVLWFGTGGEQMAASVSARPVGGVRGASGSVLSFSDVTRLMRAVAAQDDFVANVSHELRTPLTSILGYLDLALDAEELPDHVSGALSVAMRNAERLLGLVSDLLSVASGTKKLARRKVDVAAIVRAGVVSAAPRAAAGGVDITVDIPDSAPGEVDPRRMAEVVDNLLSNAVKYSPGGGTIVVRLRRDGLSLLLEVEDTGMGMSPDEQQQVFTKFFRSRRALTAAVPGAGLGLAITKNIVELHGGNLTFRSSLGEGSVFTVVLPDGPGLS